jgi:hypothetical protein
MGQNELFFKFSTNEDIGVFSLYFAYFSLKMTLFYTPNYIKKWHFLPLKGGLTRRILSDVHYARENESNIAILGLFRPFWPFYQMLNN